MNLDFFVYPFLGLGLLSMLLGPLGCFLVWRRMAFFADGLAHACTLGVPLALLLHMNFLLGICLVAFLGTLLFFMLGRGKMLPTDTVFALVAHTFFAGGIVFLSLQKNTHISIDAILFGDFLAISSFDCLILLGLFSIIFVFLWRYSSLLIMQCLHEDYAKVLDPNSNFVKALFFMITALVVAFAMYMVGALLLPAMMILPAAGARIFSKNPYTMIFGSIAVGIFGSFLGGVGSYYVDAPMSANVVLGLSLGVFMLYSVRQLTRAINQFSV